MEGSLIPTSYCGIGSGTLFPMFARSCTCIADPVADAVAERMSTMEMEHSSEHGYTPVGLML